MPPFRGLALRFLREGFFTSLTIEAGGGAGAGVGCGGGALGLRKHMLIIDY